MISVTSFLTFTHLIGLVLGVGSATVKLVLLYKSKRDPEFVAVFLRIARPVTHMIIAGLILLTLSGIGWLILGYGFSAQLIAKIILVVVIWALGPVIDNVIEPKFRKLAPAADGAYTPAFSRVLNQYLILEVTATLLFYVVIILWVLF